MIMDPKLIVADEPISALDVSIRAQVLNLMNKLKAEKESHVPFHRARPFGRPVHCRPYRRHPSRRDRGDRGFRTLFQCPLHPYTISLLSAVPMPDPVVERTLAAPSCTTPQAGSVRRAALPARDPPLALRLCHGQRDGRLREEARRDRERKESVKRRRR